MSRNKLLFIALCLFLLVANGYRWLQETPREQANQVLLGTAFWLVYVFLPVGIAGAWIYDIVRRARARSGKKEPWESEE